MVQQPHTELLIKAREMFRLSFLGEDKSKDFRDLHGILAETTRTQTTMNFKNPLSLRLFVEHFNSEANRQGRHTTGEGLEERVGR
jgi:hypothetical protein